MLVVNCYSKGLLSSRRKREYVASEWMNEWCYTVLHYFVSCTLSWVEWTEDMTINVQGLGKNPLWFSGATIWTSIPEVYYIDVLIEIGAESFGILIFCCFNSTVSEETFYKLQLQLQSKMAEVDFLFDTSLPWDLCYQTHHVQQLSAKINVCMCSAPWGQIRPSLLCSNSSVRLCLDSWKCCRDKSMACCHWQWSANIQYCSQLKINKLTEDCEQTQSIELFMCCLKIICTIFH